MSNMFEKISSSKLHSYVEAYEKIFTSVRVLGINCGADASSDGKQICTYFGNSVHNAPPPSICNIEKVISEKSEIVGFDPVDSEIYVVIDKYIEVDGEPRVIELSRPFDGDFIPESAMKKRFSDYFDKCYRDVLTGTYNRRYYEEKIRTEVIRAGLAMIDIDDFKLCNDYYGHTAGDKMLRLFSDTANKYLSDDDIFIRYGGDEFLLIIPGIEKAAFIEKLTYIRKRIHSLSIPEYPHLKVSASVGAVMCDNETIETVVDRADKLMMLAKVKKGEIFTEDKLSKSENRFEKPLVLIADHSPLNREMLSVMLGDEFSIIETSDAESCISALEKYGTEISLLLLDLTIPSEGALDVLHYIKQAQLTIDVPVVVVSGGKNNNLIHLAYELGASDCIVKPFDRDTIRHRAANIIKLYYKQRRLVSLITDRLIQEQFSEQ